MKKSSFNQTNHIQIFFFIASMPLLTAGLLLKARSTIVSGWQLLLVSDVAERNLGLSHWLNAVSSPQRKSSKEMIVFFYPTFMCRLSNQTTWITFWMQVLKQTKVDVTCVIFFSHGLKAKLSVALAFFASYTWKRASAKNLLCIHCVRSHLMSPGWQETSGGALPFISNLMCPHSLTLSQDSGMSSSPWPGFVEEQYYSCQLTSCT